MLGGELFRGLPQPELRHLVAIARRRRFVRNEVVFHRGGLAGTSRATVNRVLRAEVRRGTVELHRGQTTVVDPAGLAKRARAPGHV